MQPPAVLESGCIMSDVIVIGAGIAGCSCAYYLAADGVDVLLLDQHEPNTLASGCNAGSLHAQIPHEPFLHLGADWARQFSVCVPFCLESIRLWSRATAELGVDLEVAQVGGLIVAANDEELRQIEIKAQIERAAGLELHLLDQRALQDVAPYVSDRMRGGGLCPSEGMANPLLAATAFANEAVRLGARVVSSCEVTGVSRTACGYAVHTEQGDFTAKRIVNSAGIKAGRVAAFVGARFGIEAYPIQLSVTEPVVPLVRHLLYSARDPLTLKQMKVGTLVIGGGWPSRLDKQGRAQVSIESLTRNLALALDIVPALGSVKVVRTWASIVNGTSDWLPILGELPGERGFFMNCVPWMGFTGGPAAGRIVANLVQGREAPVDFDTRPFLPH